MQKMAMAGLGTAVLGVAVALMTWLAPPSSISYEIKFGLIVFAIILFAIGVVLLIRACLPSKPSKGKTEGTRIGFPLAIELKQGHLIQLGGEISGGRSPYASRGIDPLPATLTPQQLTAIKEVLAAHDPMKLEKEGGWTYEDHIYYIILHNKSDTIPIENIVVKLISPVFASEKFLEIPAQTINALDHIIVPLVYNRIYRQSMKGQEFANIIFCTTQGHTATAMNRTFDFTIRATAKPGLDIMKLRLEITSETNRIESLKLLPNS